MPRLINEEELHRFYGRRVLKRIYELPDGAHEEFYIFSGTIPVIILALTEKREVIAVRQFRYGANNVVLEIPGGNTKGETCFEDVRNELLEETGYMPFNGIRHLGRQLIWFDPASFTVNFFPVLALGCGKIQEPKPEKTEILETVLIPLTEWIEMIFRGDVCDSKTIATTFLALQELNFEVKPK